MKLRIAKAYGDSIVPKSPKLGDLGIDLFAHLDVDQKKVVVPPHEQRVISSGIIVEFPMEYGAIIRPRGKDKFIVGSGVIDSGYRGEIMVRVFNPYDYPMTFKQGDSIGQMVMQQVYHIDIEEVDIEDINLNTERGNSGGILNG